MWVGGKFSRDVLPISLLQFGAATWNKQVEAPFFCCATPFSSSFGTTFFAGFREFFSR
jgi:hypothetical protein